MARSKKPTKKSAARKTPKPAKKPAKAAAKPKPKPSKAKAKPAAKPTAKAKPAAKPAAKAKLAAKPTAAKAKPATERTTTPATTAPTVAHLAKLAIDGDLDVLLGLLDGVPERERDITAYKWLAVASDFGHEDADEMQGDLLESSSLRYDDDRYETGNAHWELGLAYLTGSDGLPRDLDKARSQLASAKENHYPMSVQESDVLQAQARARLAPDALAVFDAVFAGDSGRIDERGGEGEEEDG